MQFRCFLLILVTLGLGVTTTRGDTQPTAAPASLTTAAAYRFEYNGKPVNARILILSGTLKDVTLCTLKRAHAAQKEIVMCQTSLMIEGEMPAVSCR